MRLQQQLAIVERALPVLANMAWENAPNGLTTGNKSAVAGALKELTLLPYFVQLIGPLLTFHTFAVDGDQIFLDHASHHEWNTSYIQILTRLQIMKEALSFALPKTEEHSIAVRLPETASLDEISKMVVDIDQILRPLVEAPRAKVDIRVRGFDTGSMWILVALGSAAAVCIVRNLCKAAKEVLSLELEAERNRLSLKRMSVEQSILDTIQAQVDKTRRAQIRELAEAIDLQDFDEKPENERIARIDRSIDLLVKLNQKGGEIRQAIEPVRADHEEQYPDIKGLLEQKRKELEILEDKLLGPVTKSVDGTSK